MHSLFTAQAWNQGKGIGVDRAPLFGLSKEEQGEWSARIRAKRFPPSTWENNISRAFGLEEASDPEYLCVVVREIEESFVALALDTFEVEGLMAIPTRIWGDYIRALGEILHKVPLNHLLESSSDKAPLYSTFRVPSTLTMSPPRYPRDQMFTSSVLTDGFIVTPFIPANLLLALWKQVRCGTSISWYSRDAGEIIETPLGDLLEGCYDIHSLSERPCLGCSKSGECVPYLGSKANLPLPSFSNPKKPLPSKRRLQAGLGRGPCKFVLPSLLRGAARKHSRPYYGFPSRIDTRGLSFVGVEKLIAEHEEKKEQVKAWRHKEVYDCSKCLLQTTCANMRLKTTVPKSEIPRICKGPLVQGPKENLSTWVKLVVEAITLPEAEENARFSKELEKALLGITLDTYASTLVELTKETNLEDKVFRRHSSGICILPETVVCVLNSNSAALPRTEYTPLWGTFRGERGLVIPNLGDLIYRELGMVRPKKRSSWSILSRKPYSSFMYAESGTAGGGWIARDCKSYLDTVGLCSGSKKEGPSLEYLQKYVLTALLLLFCPTGYTMSSGGWGVLTKYSLLTSLGSSCRNWLPGYGWEYWSSLPQDVSLEGVIDSFVLQRYWSRNTTNCAAHERAGVVQRAESLWFNNFSSVLLAWLNEKAYFVGGPKNYSAPLNHSGRQAKKELLALREILAEEE